MLINIIYTDYSSSKKITHQYFMSIIHFIYLYLNIYIFAYWLIFNLYYMIKQRKPL